MKFKFRRIKGSSLLVVVAGLALMTTAGTYMMSQRGQNAIELAQNISNSASQEQAMSHALVLAKRMQESGVAAIKSPGPGNCTSGTMGVAYTDSGVKYRCSYLLLLPIVGLTSNYLLSVDKLANDDHVLASTGLKVTISPPGPAAN